MGKERSDDAARVERQMTWSEAAKLARELKLKYVFVRVSRKSTERQRNREPEKHHQSDLMDCSLIEFARRVRRCIEDEQKKVNPDNYLIAVLCDAGRLAYEDARRRVLTLEEAASMAIKAMKEHAERNESLRSKLGITAVNYMIVKAYRFWIPDPQPEVNLKDGPNRE